MKNKKDVAINIKSIQTLDNDRDTTELFTCGMLSHKRDNEYTLSYTENISNGFEGNKVSLDVKGDKMVIMQRSGDAPSNLVIEKGKKHHCHYGTPFGDFMVGISTDDIVCNLHDSGGDLYLKYTVDVNSTLMSENEMYIDFKIDGNE